jgi:hypothetical protein
MVFLILTLVNINIPDSGVSKQVKFWIKSKKYFYIFAMREPFFFFFLKKEKNRKDKYIFYTRFAFHNISLQLDTK